MKKIYLLKFIFVLVGLSTVCSQVITAKTQVLANPKMAALIGMQQNKNITASQQSQLNKIATLKQAEGVKAKQASTYTHSLDSVLTFDTNDEITGRDFYTYTSKGQLSIYMTTFIDLTSGLWLGIPLYYYYDENGYNNLIISAYFNKEKNQWVESTKGEFVHAANGDILSETYYYKNDSTKLWEIDYKFISTYDAQGNVLTQDYYDWSYYSNAIVLMGQYKYEYKFDSHSNLTRKDSYEWDKPTNSWVSSGIDSTEYKYNNNGKITQQIGYQTIYSTLVPMYNYEYSYNAAGERNEEINYIYDYYTLAWTPFTKKSKTFENTLLLAETIIPAIATDVDNELVKNTENFDWAINAKDWALKYTTTSFYGSLKTALNNTKDLKATVIYNNSNKTLSVSGLESANSTILNIFNMQGKIVYTKILTNNKSENITFLPHGMYFYKLTSNDKSSSGKFIK